MQIDASWWYSHFIELIKFCFSSSLIGIYFSFPHSIWTSFIFFTWLNNLNFIPMHRPYFFLINFAHITFHLQVSAFSHQFLLLNRYALSQLSAYSITHTHIQVFLRPSKSLRHCNSLIKVPFASVFLTACHMSNSVNTSIFSRVFS